MAREMSPELIRWSAASLVGWEYDGSLRVPIRSIHGGRDEVIPLRNVRPDFVIPEGRHLLSPQHPDAVNRFIAETLRASAASRVPLPVR